MNKYKYLDFVFRQLCLCNLVNQPEMKRVISAISRIDLHVSVNTLVGRTQLKFPKTSAAHQK